MSKAKVRKGSIADIDDFVKMRDEALHSLDKKKIIKYMKTYGIPIPKDGEVFWAMVHKSRCHMLSTTKKQREESRKWLLENGFTTEIR